MQDLVDRIVERTGLGPDKAARAVSIILNFLNREAPPDRACALMQAIPGTEAVLDAPPGAGGGSGFAGAMQAFGELNEAGLDMRDVQEVGAIVLDHARRHAGAEAVDAVVEGIPGLGQFV